MAADCFNGNECLIVRRVRDALFELTAEVLDATEYWRGGGITKYTKRAACDIARHVDQNIRVAVFALILLQPFQNVHEPIVTLAAGSTLAARLVSVKAQQAVCHLYNVGIFIEDG